MLLVIEGYTVMSLQTIEKLADSTYDTSLLISENVFSILLLTAIILAPLLMIVYFILNHGKFRQKLFMRRFNLVMGELNFRNRFSPVFISLFCYRRLFQALLIVFVAQYPSLQVQSMTLQLIMVVMIFGHISAYRTR